MRILYHHRTLADGAEGIHIQEMVEAFEAMGHEVRVHALAAPARRGEGRPGIWSRIKRALPAPVFEVAAGAYSVLDFVTFLKVARSWRPDVVYKRHAMYDVGVTRAARRLGIPIVLEVNRPYSLDAYFEFEPVWFPALVRAFERDALHAASVIVAVSTPLAKYIAPLCREPDRILVLPNGANPVRFGFDEAGRARVRAALGIGPNLVVGWSGILRPWHGVDVLIDAVGRVRGCRLMIVGDGPDRTRLAAHAAAAGIPERVVFTGRVRHDEMSQFTSAMDVAVVAHDRTGVASPMKLLEYMATSRAVIAPRLPNIEDIVTDGVDGVLFEQGSADALAGALRRLADDPALRARLGTHARLTVERERNWRANAASVLRALAESRRAAAPVPALARIGDG